MNPFEDIVRKRPLLVLVACEHSCVVRDAFNDLGHLATSCDLLPADNPKGDHYQGDVFDIIDQGWDLMICHPPCTYLSSSGLHWTVNGHRPKWKTERAVEFAVRLWESNIPKICLENPKGILSRYIGKANQMVQPYDFGHDASKETFLWLKGLPNLKHTKHVKPKIIGGEKRWGNQTYSGQNALPPSEKRQRERSKTYAGIAKAMAKQWGGLVRK